MLFFSTASHEAFHRINLRKYASKYPALHPKPTVSNAINDHFYNVILNGTVNDLMRRDHVTKQAKFYKLILMGKIFKTILNCCYLSFSNLKNNSKKEGSVSSIK